MTSISSVAGSLSSLTSYYAKLTAAQTEADDGTDGATVDATGTDASMTAADVEALMRLGDATGTNSDPAGTSNLLGASSGSGALASLLGSTFTDTNSLLSQISALATGSSTTDGSTTSDGSTGDTSTTSTTSNATQQQKISSLLANMMQTEQQDSLTLFL